VCVRVRACVCVCERERSHLLAHFLEKTEFSAQILIELTTFTEIFSVSCKSGVLFVYDAVFPADFWDQLREYTQHDRFFGLSLKQPYQCVY
jgi:hypothetical protein